MTAKTTAELQRAFRERKKSRGLYQVSGLYAPRDLHPAIRAYVLELVARRVPDAPGETCFRQMTLPDA